MAAILRTMLASAVVERLRALVAGAPDEVSTVYVFGSIARGSAAPGDVDLAVIVRPDPPAALADRLADLEADLTRDLQIPVQIVVANSAPPDLLHRVLRDGQVILDRDSGIRIRFEVHTRNQYFDLLPFLTRYRQRALARASESR